MRQLRGWALVHSLDKLTHLQGGTKGLGGFTAWFHSAFALWHMEQDTLPLSLLYTLGIKCIMDWSKGLQWCGIYYEGWVMTLMSCSHHMQRQL